VVLTWGFVSMDYKDEIIFHHQGSRRMLPSFNCKPLRKKIKNCD
jgi:hypothetical protein